MSGHNSWLFFIVLIALAGLTVVARLSDMQLRDKIDALEKRVEQLEGR